VHAVCVGSFSAAFAKSRWLLFCFAMINVHEYFRILFNKIDISHFSCIVDMMKTNSALNHQISYSVLL